MIVTVDEVKTHLRIEHNESVLRDAGIIAPLQEVIPDDRDG